MRSEAHVVVIGAGMIGLSCAYWLSKFGVEDIVVVDREKDIAKGATSRCAGVITENFHDKTLVNLARESKKLYRQITCGLVNNGQLFLYGDLEKIGEAKKNAKMQKELHVSVEELERAYIFEHIPAAFLDDINLGILYKGDATADVEKVIKHFKDECDINEVEFLFDTGIRHINSREGKIVEVATNKGNIKTNIIINAAGAHAGVVGHLAGVDVPVLPMRMHALTTTAVSEISSKIPSVNDQRYNILTLPYKEGFYLLQQYHHEEHGFFTGVEDHFIHDMLFDVEKRFPAFSSARIKDKFSGYHSITPDKKPIIGETSLKGFYCACGFNGHGFTFAPVIGMIIADMIVHPESRHDITGLEWKRFKKKKN
ncbi:NAD(P)/FAD-dependent oxidoreductase [Thermoproteota archaeon]